MSGFYSWPFSTDEWPGALFRSYKKEMLLLGSGFLVYLFAFLISRQQV